jgi:hypothetical protein
MAKYQQLLRKHCSAEANVLNFMLTYINASDYIRAEVYGNKPEDLPQNSLVWENARLWHKIAQLHLRDVEDLEHNVASLRNALPTIPTPVTAESRCQLPMLQLPAAITYSRWTPSWTPRIICSP